MAKGASSSNASRLRKRVEVEAEVEAESSSHALKRARDGSAFARCEECKKDVHVALIKFHDCSFDAQIKMNLEAQVVEIPTEVKKKPTISKRKNRQTNPGAKKAKNPNARKRPPTAFFLFMRDFRKWFKETNPDCKSVSTVAKEGGVKWRSLTDEEKKEYTDKAAELKAEFKKTEESDEDENEQEQDADGSSEEEVKEGVEEVKDEIESNEAGYIDDQEKEEYINKAAELKAEFEKAEESNEAQNDIDVDVSSETEVEDGVEEFKDEIEADDNRVL